MRFIKIYTAPILGVLSSLSLTACNDSGSSVPSSPGTAIGTPGTDSPVSAVTLTNSGMKAFFVPAGSLPAPTSSVLNPRVVLVTDRVAAASPIQVDIVRASPVDDILIGLPGNQGYFDLNVRGIALSTLTYRDTAYPVTLNLSTTASSLIPLNIQTVSGGFASPVTTLNLLTTTYNSFDTIGCGGGNVTASFSQVVNADANTSPATFEFGGATFIPYPPNPLNDATSINIGSCTEGPGQIDRGRKFSISIRGQPIAGHTYRLSPPGGSDGSMGYEGFTAEEGTLTVQAVTGQTLTFTVHASMGPFPSELPPSVPRPPSGGSFTVDLSGTVGITGL